MPELRQENRPVHLESPCSLPHLVCGTGETSGWRHLVRGWKRNTEAERELRPKNTDTGITGIKMLVEGAAVERPYTVIRGLRTALDLSNVSSWKEDKMQETILNLACSESKCCFYAVLEFPFWFLEKGPRCLQSTERLLSVTGTGRGQRRQQHFASLSFSKSWRGRCYVFVFCFFSRQNPTTALLPH